MLNQTADAVTSRDSSDASERPFADASEDVGHDSVVTEPEVEDRLPLPDSIVKGDIRWDYAIGIAGVHLLAILAFFPYFFTWTGVIVMVAGVFVFGQSINFCYHRILSHKSARIPKWLEHFWVFMALCCLQDTPGRWVAIHRYHHKHSDHQEDPHSPLVAFLWSHVGWLLVHNRETDRVAHYGKYAPDVLKDRWYMKLEKGFSWTLYYFAHAAAFFVVGLLIGWATTDLAFGVRLGLSLLVWGVLVRTVAVWHITWSVNSLTHMFGYSSHKTGDHSRNNWLVALLAVGEGWHNNHHADPVSASNQHKWWEVDLTYYHIKVLGWLGLAKEIKAPRHKRQAANAARRVQPGA